MMDRRELLKSSLLGCGAAVASSALGSRFSRAVLADDTAPTRPIVKTSLGWLRGALANGVYSFKGIHYGASTEGRMRFLPPSTPKPWTGVRDALEIGPPAPQLTEWPSRSAELQQLLGDMVGPGQMGEDCLVLNLWTPSLHNPYKRPVMVWLHGGGYVIGSGGIPLYDGTNLAAKHDVVVVGLNHRLNFFGHLYTGAIGGQKYADSGNVGLLDMVLALQWVRANIRSFGGDPARVTIFGESGGGGKVGALLAMPSAKGLFQKAIVESGSELRVSSREEANATARKFLAQLHVAPDRVDDLQMIPMDRLIAAQSSMGESFFSLGPVVDGRSLPRHPFDPDAPTISADVPMLIGTNGDETTTLLGMRDPAFPALFSLNEADLRTKLKAHLQLADDSNIESLIALYRKNRPNATPSDIFFAITTDSMFRMDAITQAERKVAQHAAPVYMYIFEWQTPVRGGKLKAMHGVELPFVFDNVDKVLRWIGEGVGRQPLADKVSSTWAEFARTGNPNHTGLPHWPAYETGTRATMIFNDECKVVNDPGKDERLAIASMPQR
jgi:para-nitrobenzyl esterase